MTLSVIRDNNLFLLHPPSEAGVSAGLFDPKWLESSGLLLARQNAGRASVAFFREGNYEFVLRDYRRGGAVAKISKGDYLWTGLRQTRAWRELALLQSMTEKRLPVPRPRAALVRKSGLSYQAALITYRLAETETFADMLKKNPVPETVWQAIGGVIRVFHDHNICHADLNASNILINSDRRIFLIDFDKGRIMPAGRDGWKFDNLARLQRSLKKFHGRYPVFHYSAAAWSLLAKGYANRVGQI
ncbi:MAG: 3-deoxy-D-manno-octulosonic acid kinase [Gammaproteobacteria bacterium]|nr:3-deoxy-D-manno-octulosonic acid kinase [Gammaproteobacteria bacterium]